MAHVFGQCTLDSWIADKRRPLGCRLVLSSPSLGKAPIDLGSATTAPLCSPLGEGLMREGVLPRKEVIQPQLPLRLPCYDFVPIAGPTLDGCLLAVSPPASGVTNFHDVTGGVYKARERIHRSNADLRLLATPASCRRVSACNPN
jgi:hypothetical protein